MGFRVDGTGNSEFKFNNVSANKRAEELPNSIIRLEPKNLDKVELSQSVQAAETALRVSSLADKGMQKLKDDPAGYKGYSYLSPWTEERLPEFADLMADLMEQPVNGVPDIWDLEGGLA